MRTRVEIQVKAKTTGRIYSSMSQQIMDEEDERIFAVLDEMNLEDLDGMSTSSTEEIEPITMASLEETMAEFRLATAFPVETPQQALERLGNATYRPTRILMSPQDFNDILSWGQDSNLDPFIDMDVPPLRDYTHLIVTTD